MNKTRAADVRTHAVSPVSIFGPSCASACVAVAISAANTDRDTPPQCLICLMLTSTPSLWISGAARFACTGGFDAHDTTSVAKAATNGSIPAPTARNAAL